MSKTKPTFAKSIDLEGLLAKIYPDGIPDILNEPRDRPFRVEMRGGGTWGTGTASWVLKEDWHNSNGARQRWVSLGLTKPGRNGRDDALENFAPEPTAKVEEFIGEMLEKAERRIEREKAEKARRKTLKEACQRDWDAHKEEVLASGLFEAYYGGDLGEAVDRYGWKVMVAKRTGPFNGFGKLAFTLEETPEGLVIRFLGVSGPLSMFKRFMLSRERAIELREHLEIAVMNETNPLD